MTTSTRSEPAELAIIIPARDAAGHLPISLRAVRERFPDVPVLVVDDASSDETARVARDLGAEVLSLASQSGPAGARNAGARATEAKILLFLDADCVPHADVVERVRAAFREAPDLVSLTGSYDADPQQRDFFSSYMNLRHHFTHQWARAEPGTFWAGCGAVRREAFLRVGGFDAARYRSPQIEDVELGQRLRGAGRMRLDAALQVKHLKRWSLCSVVRTDLFDRAIPWAQLVRESGALPDDLNFRLSQRAAAALAPLVLISLPVAVWAAATGRGAWLGMGLAVLAASLGLHASLLRGFARARGARFAVGAWLFHQIHLVYSTAAFVAGGIVHRPNARRPRSGRDADSG